MTTSVLRRLASSGRSKSARRAAFMSAWSAAGTPWPDTRKQPRRSHPQPGRLLRRHADQSPGPPPSGAPPPGAALLAAGWITQRLRRRGCCIYKSAVKGTKGGRAAPLVGKFSRRRAAGRDGQFLCCQLAQAMDRHACLSAQHSHGNHDRSPTIFLQLI